jgi:hypothetical protein
LGFQQSVVVTWPLGFVLTKRHLLPLQYASGQIAAQGLRLMLGASVNWNGNAILEVVTFSEGNVQGVGSLSEPQKSQVLDVPRLERVKLSSQIMVV